MFKVEQLSVHGFDHNFSYLIVAANGEGALVDPTGDIEVIVEAIGRLKVTAPKYILLTHSHPDHVAKVEAIKSFFSAPVVAHSQSKFDFDRVLQDGEKLNLGGDGGFIEAIFTPGHSADSVCYRLSDNSGLFTGDTLFIGCCGYCRPERMFKSLQHLKSLSGDLVIYSGHDYGDKPVAKLAAELVDNPFLNTDDFHEFKQRLRSL